MSAYLLFLLNINTKLWNTKEYNRNTSRPKEYNFIIRNTITRYMSDPKRKISASIPISLLDQLQKIGYISPTEAVLTGFELLVNGANSETRDQIEEYKKQIEEYERDKTEYNRKIEEYKNERMEYKERIAEYKNEIVENKGNIEKCLKNTELLQAENKSLNDQLIEYTKQIVEYKNNIKEYKMELTEFKNNIEEYKREIIEYSMRIESLHAEDKIIKEYNTTLKQELEDTKELHRNYMLQMQTLITQKQIEAPGVKKPWWRFW